MPFDRREIMQEAWAIYRVVGKDMLAGIGPHGRRRRWANSLRRSWAIAKNSPRAVNAQVQRITESILILECKDRLAWSDFQHLDELRRELTNAETLAAHAA